MAEQEAEPEAEAEPLPDGELKVYLEEGGVLDAWARMLVALHSEAEKPENPMGFLEEFFGENKNAEIAALKEQLAAAEAESAGLKEQIATLEAAGRAEAE